ncbi:MAG: hypothetical protein KDB00_23725 [Planctomycetales bacterium]|nr:hypothetical protein [Planctomycetales bacterium]
MNGHNDTQVNGIGNGPVGQQRGEPLDKQCGEQVDQGLHWVFYALGGGMGHLTRTIALARAVLKDHAAKQKPINLTILTNSRFANILSVGEELGHDHRVITIHPDLTREEVACHITNLLVHLEPDVLVVDTFPRGIGGELAELLPRLRCHKVLVHRDLNPRYVERFKVAEFLNHYDQIMVPGEECRFDSQPQITRTDPWLIRDADELLAPDAARRMLEIENGDLPVVAVLGCGRIDEVAQMRDLAIRIGRRLHGSAIVRFVTKDSDWYEIEDESNVTALGLWPFFEAIRGVSIVVGAGGYNTVHETRAAGKPLIAMPWPRLYDRQARRLTDAETVASLRDAERRVETLIDSGDFHNDPPRFQNGVHAATASIQL